MEQSTSEHLVSALRAFHGELRRAGVAKEPDRDETAVIARLQDTLAELSSTGAVSPELGEALADTAATCGWLLEPREERVLDWATGA